MRRNTRRWLWISGLWVLALAGIATSYAEDRGHASPGCHDWAKTQTGFDPTQPGGGASGASHDQYQRATTACVEARGYSVR